MRLLLALLLAHLPAVAEDLQRGAVVVLDRERLRLRRLALSGRR